MNNNTKPRLQIFLDAIASGKISAVSEMSPHLLPAFRDLCEHWLNAIDEQMEELEENTKNNPEIH